VLKAVEVILIVLEDFQVLEVQVMVPAVEQQVIKTTHQPVNLVVRVNLVVQETMVTAVAVAVVLPINTFIQPS
jgi:hypothetical protein